MTAIENQHLDLTTIDFAAVTNCADLPQPMTPPLKRALYKAKPEDFVVNERLEVDFTDAGEHLWLHIEKSEINTAYLAKLLSEWADIPLRDVGYSGLKDRQALTTQWFSLRLPKKQKPDSDFAPVDIKEHETVKIIAEHWHNKKLNRGTHNANQFVITLRDIEFAKDQTLGDKSSVEQHLQTISKTGVPNYFGPQRFGFGGNNIREALNLFARPLKSTSSAKKKNKRKSAVREQNSMELSAARSLIFNQILAARVQDGSWNTGLNGDVFNLNGSGSIFASEHMDETLQARLASGDIHPTAVMWGAGNNKVAGEAAELENTVVQQDALLAALATGLEQREVKAQRRALRLPVEDLSCRWADEQDEEQTLVLSFTLTTGSFATSVLASVVEHLTVR
ncbi:tRNA pseudouridine(13) synthase TruD [Psychrobacter sp. Ps3]|uniref:tRNA pseudouridine(13) synthase TruD n=1 Tax=Psychrobacter sp. Ps3 TaxID=2790957 RepID=UPI001EDE56F7|nr:tRNA pseudouridine(13) synthase TruD [Psychrobacter sp. Ps3]MCG3881961.1 tRNA pseudouridine(13) synthase TruD [Psychrobacter sp. Ps3]